MKNLKKSILSIVFVFLCVVMAWVMVSLIFGTENPFYVVASGSMYPALQTYDIIVISEYENFEDIEIGDIIVFTKPIDPDRVIVHRIISITDNDPKTVRTKGDANLASIQYVDYPITDKEYIGKVMYVIPYAGYVTQVLKFPINYMIIAVIIGAIITKYFLNGTLQKMIGRP